MLLNVTNCNLIQYFFPVDPDWHLIIGGFYWQGSGDPFISSVELYNWRSGKQCKLPDFPIPVCCGAAAVLDGTPAYCGGYSESVSQRGCYRFEKNDSTWTPVSWLLTFYKMPTK
jgi:hypothetical protein